MTGDRPILRIELLRDGAWSVRGEHPFGGTIADIRAAAPGYALRHPHRFLLDGIVVHEQPAGGA